jgi:hypothetical protein
MGFDLADQLMIRYSAFDRYWRRNSSTMRQTVHQLFIDFKKVCDSVKKDVLYNIPIEFGVPMKLVRLIKMCLNETYSKVCIGKHLSDSFPIQNGLKQRDALTPMLFNFGLEYAIRNGQENQMCPKLSWTHRRRRRRRTTDDGRRATGL